MSAPEQNESPDMGAGRGEVWAQIAAIAVFAVAAALLLAGIVVQAFWPDLIAGNDPRLNLILLSVCATALIGGLAMMVRHYVVTGLGMVLIALIPLVWIVFGQGVGGGVAGTGAVTAAAQCQGAPWVNERRNFAVDRLDEAIDFFVFPPGEATAYYRFRVTEAAAVRLEAKAGDPALILTDAEGHTLQANDDVAGGSVSAQIETELAEGTYCLGVRSISGPTQHNVRIGLQSHEPLIKVPFHACQAEDIPTLQLEGQADIQIAADEYKALRVTVRDGIVLEAKSSAVDPKLMVYTFGGDELASDDDGGVRMNALLALAGHDISDGEYCLVIDAVSDNSGGVSVSAAAYDPEAIAAREIAQGLQVPGVGADMVQRLGVIDSPVSETVRVDRKNATVRWYQFELTEGGLVVIDLAERGTGDPVLALYEANGHEIARDDDGGEGQNSRISAPLSPGEYMLSAGSVNSDPLVGQLDIRTYEAQ